MSDWLSSIENPVVVFALILAGWLVVTALVYRASQVAVHWLTYRSRTQVDDIIIRIIGRPLILLLISYGTLHAWETAFGASSITDTLQRVHQGLVIFLTAYVAWRVLREVIVAYLQPIVQESGNQADDILIPLLSRVGPVIIFVAALNAIVAVMGGDLAAWLTGIGLLGIVVGYLFQEPLQGLFSGTYLALDSPFRANDLVLIDNTTLCQVYNVGVRVTQLYDVKRRNLMYVPNTDLVTKHIVNVSKPSVEQRMSLSVVIDRALDPQTARSLLVEACNAHENILGDWPSKQAAIEARRAAYQSEYITMLDSAGLDQSDRAKQVWLEQQIVRLNGELIRLQVEHILRQSGEDFSALLLHLVQKVSQLEDLGFTASERDVVRQDVATIMTVFDGLVEQVTVWLYLVKIIQYDMSDSGYVACIQRFASRNLLSDNRMTLKELAECEAPGAPTRPMVVRDELAKIRSSELEADKAVDRTEFMTRADYADYKRLYTIWHRSIAQAYDSLVQVYELKGLQGGEWHLDEQIRQIELHVANNFLLRVGRWQLPTANLVDVSDSELKFEVEFSIDDVMRDQFQRAERVTAELLMDIDRIRAAYQISLAAESVVDLHPTSPNSPNLLSS